MAGYKPVRAIARKLRRTKDAVRYRLTVLGKSSRVHRDGYSRRALAEELHLGRRTVQRWIAEGLLEVRDPRITMRSLNKLRKSLHASRTAHPPCSDHALPMPEQPPRAYHLFVPALRAFLIHNSGFPRR